MIRAVSGRAANVIYFFSSFFEEKKSKSNDGSFVMKNDISIANYCLLSDKKGLEKNVFFISWKPKIYKI